MHDPLTAISLASAIVQFVDYGTKIVLNTKEIYQSTSGATDANNRLEAVMDAMMNLYIKLSAGDSLLQSDTERTLCHIARECHVLSKAISEILQKIKRRKANSVMSSYLAATKSMWHAK
jgi:hypothetical protein